MSLLLAGLPKEVPGIDRQPAVRLGHGCGDHRGARHQGRRGRADDRRRRRIDVARALRHAEGRRTAFSRNAEIYDTTIGWRFVNPLMKKQYGVDSMPETGENVAEDFQVSRADQDAFAVRSQDKAVAAQANGRLAKEITPVTIPQRKGEPVVVAQGRASARRHDASRRWPSCRRRSARAAR